jgi:hypothetical protein
MLACGIHVDDLLYEKGKVIGIRALRPPPYVTNPANRHLSKLWEVAVSCQLRKIPVCGDSVNK